MRSFSLCSVTDCDMVFSFGDSVVLSGKNPWIFRKDGTFVSKLKTIRNSYRMEYLPGNMVLMDGGVDRAYHYVSLDSGEILRSWAKKGRRYTLLGGYAVSPNGKVIYHVYCNNNKFQVDHIDLEKETYTTYVIPVDYGSIRYCYCDDCGYLSLLISSLVHDTQENGKDHSYQTTGILTWLPGSSETTWKHQWKSTDVTNPDGTRFDAKMCDDNYVLSGDLTVLSLRTGETFDLLENTPGLNRTPRSANILAYDPERKLLTVRFLHSGSNIIIDCRSRKIVAHYVPITPGLSGGCLIGDEFWIGTSNGVIKRPFPHMDDFPRRL